MKTLLTVILTLLICAPMAFAAQATVDDESVAQVKRVIGDPLVKAFVKDVQVNDRVTCKTPSLQTAEKSISWACLNNMTCGYSFVIPCYNSKNAKVLTITASGIDDNSVNELESIVLKRMK